jgi:hypothetical protein
VMPSKGLVHSTIESDANEGAGCVFGIDHGSL